ncbi:hypothetical protein ACM6Q7_12060 [Peribacillus butanolivorans]
MYQNIIFLETCDSVRELIVGMDNKNNVNKVSVKESRKERL